MSSENQRPFIDTRAFEKANSSYVPFASQADAMLASLQLFHDIPCRIMDNIFSVVTHPDFDAKQVTLRNSMDVIDVVEKRRVKDRVAVVQERAASRDGCVKQAGFPHFILYEVLDIIHSDRLESIRTKFEETLDNKAMYCDSMDIKEDNTLQAMTVVHRSWTTLAQKALGRVLHIGRPTDEMDVLLSPVRKSIFGPWTSVVAVQFYHPITATIGDDEDGSYAYLEDVEVLDKYRNWFENLHRILIGFTNLKCLYIKSYASLFTKWSNLTFGKMVRRNVQLEEVTLYTMRDEEVFDLDPLLENARILEHLRTLNIRRAWMSDMAVGNAMQVPGFACLNNVTIRRSFSLIKHDLTLLSILSSQLKSRLKSLRIIDDCERKQSFEEDMAWAFVPSQCAAIFEQLRSLHIDSRAAADQWIKWIGPYCSNLESLSIIDGSDARQSFEENIQRASSSPQSAIVFARLCTLCISCKTAADLWLKWIGPSCSNLQSMTLSLNVSLTPDTLKFIPITIQSLDLALWTEWDTEMEEATGWMRHLLKIASTKHFSKLKTFTWFLSKDRLRFIESLHYYEKQEQSLRTEMQNVKEEMSAVCKGVGVKCYLNL